MANRFRVTSLHTTKIIKNVTIISVILLSFFLVLFSKTDYFLINSIKNISSGFINPITRIVASPLNAMSNLVNQYDQFRN